MKGGRFNLIVCAGLLDKFSLIVRASLFGPLSGCSLAISLNILSRHSLLKWCLELFCRGLFATSGLLNWYNFIVSRGLLARLCLLNCCNLIVCPGL